MLTKEDRLVCDYCNVQKSGEVDLIASGHRHFCRKCWAVAANPHAVLMAVKDAEARIMSKVKEAWDKAMAAHCLATDAMEKLTAPFNTEINAVVTPVITERKNKK